MKSFLKLNTIALIILLTACKSGAQTEQGNNNPQITKESLKNSTPEQRAKFLTDTMNAVLNLSEEEYSQVYNINLDIANKNAAILKSDDGKLSKFKQIKANQDARDTALQKVLTQEQFDTYKQKEDELMQKFKQRAGNAND